jgi:Zn-dependent protease
VELTRFLVAWRTIAVGDREVIDALVDPVHATPSAELRGALAAWPGSWYWSDEDGQRHLVLTRPYPGRARERWGVHIALFLATLITTTLTGALVAGGLPHTSPIGLPGLGLPLPELLRGLARGLLFSLPLLAILLAHELGHYVTARRYDLDVSPPYFLPLPVVGVVPGTLGAFIRLRTLVSDRRQLLDVAAAGPIAGFVVALPLLALGVALSQPSDANGVVILVGDLMTPLGDSFVTWAVRAATMGEVSGLILHPTAIAGYVGILVTMLNLLPISQLDGGHIVFATLPRWQKRVAAAFLALILALGWYSRWPWWWVFGAVVLLLSRGRLGNPPVLDAYRPLPTSRRWLGWAALALFLLTFTPAPVRV